MTVVYTPKNMGHVSLVDYRALMAHAVEPSNALALALAGTIAEGIKSGVRPLIMGLDEDEFRRMVRHFFPDVRLENGVCSRTVRAADEFEELLELLLDFRVEAGETLRWLSHVVATAAMRNNHLWQDMGLPNRKLLSRLMAENFPLLAARNVADMKWKKFFYRQLCERAGVPMCKSPNCADCSDYGICFGSEGD